MINDILVHLSAGSPNDVARDYAISIAKSFDAHLSGVVLTPEFPTWAATEGADTKTIEQWRAEQRDEADKAIRTFDEMARLRDTHSDSRIISSRHGDSARIFGEIARNYDLSVVAQTQDEIDLYNDLVIEAALFNSGRPVLVVPFIQTADMKLDRVMACWDGSQHAARAIGTAMPFLERARKVEVVTIQDADRPKELCGIKMAEHLSRHHINVELKPIVTPNSEVADVILNEVADAGIDLVVMGAYGHSRFREFVLGGVTRSMLKAMTAPALMAH
ncbi:MAG: universal stress protein [Rhizobiales bacterium]|nr:universal stress protein [Hyphomicrobiales bacterium]